MDTAEFQRTLNIGLGRPILYLREHSAFPYRDAILYACLNVTALDPQAAGSRADYLWEVLRLTGEPEFYRLPILDALAAAVVPENYLPGWLLVQLMEMALKYAKQGDQKAIQIIRQKFAESIAAGRTEPASVILLLDGLDGLVSVVSQWFQTVPEVFDDSDFSFHCSLVKPKNYLVKQKRALCCVMRG